MGWDAIRGYVVVLMDVRGTGFQVGVLFLPSANNQHCYPYFFVYLIFPYHVYTRRLFGCTVPKIQ